ncbi:MAG TPA: CNNM domain-containing protein, partial [Pseudomonadales bacterium]|nr:CNNM domain-containing protein [Pseudomonadales bacterium]
MNDLDISTLLLILLGLTFFVAFFAGSETGMMSINRYRLRHMVKNNVPGAKITQKLLQRPDRLISTILIGNNFINNFAAAIATVIGLRLLGDGGLETATAIITFIMLIFGEVMPKTFAALKPERFALPASYILLPMLKIMYPVVWTINVISNTLLKIFGLNVEEAGPEHLSREELRTIIHEAGAMIPRRHQKMLLSILDLEHSTVEDVMVPISEIEGIDINDDLNNILTQLRSAQYSRVPVYDTDINNPIGILLLRKMARALGQN